MKTYNLCFLGFGNVGRALARLLVSKSAELRERHGIEWRVTGVASRSRGWMSNSTGFDVTTLISGDNIGFLRSKGIHDWLQNTQPDVVFDTTSLNPESGQPAIEYLTATLEAGAHALTANKGTVVYGLDELNEAARSAGKRYLFESTVLDGAPVFSLFREALPAIRLRAFSGLLNSTTNVIIETMEAGRTFEEGVKTARELGVNETEPSHDIDGWDAVVKVCALARVLMNIPLKPSDVRREGVRDLTPQVVQAARAEGKPFKLVARARAMDDGSVSASVRPEQLTSGDPLANVRGTSLAAHFELDMMPGLTITSHRPNLQSTAYGLLADFVKAVKG